MSDEWRFRTLIQGRIDALYARMEADRTPKPLNIERESDDTRHLRSQLSTEEPETARKATPMSTRGEPDERVLVLSCLLELVDHLIAAAPEPRPTYRSGGKYDDLPPKPPAR